MLLPRGGAASKLQSTAMADRGVWFSWGSGAQNHATMQCDHMRAVVADVTFLLTCTCAVAATLDCNTCVPVRAPVHRRLWRTVSRR